jgi:hypothetical protein
MLCTFERITDDRRRREREREREREGASDFGIVGYFSSFVTGAVE